MHERINLPGDTVQITLQGLRRILIEGVSQTAPFPVVRIKAAKEVAPDSDEVDELVSKIVAGAETLVELVDRVPDEVPAILKMNVSDPGRFADLAATNLNLKISDRGDLASSSASVIGQRPQRPPSAEMSVRLQRGPRRRRRRGRSVTEIKIEEHQREFYLRQQLRAIQSELGEADPGEREASEMAR